jgi:hypothetical protein
MSDTAVLDSPAEKEYEQLIEIPIRYVERQFPKEEGEYLAKYVQVMEHCFRINFFKKRNKSLFSDSYINRSYFVMLTRKGNSWEHVVK